ncbi:type II secretion system F family protein [Nakamurella sp. GG22]
MQVTGTITAMLVASAALLAVPPPVRLPPRNDGPPLPSPAPRSRRAATVGLLTGTGIVLLDPDLWWLALIVAAVTVIGVLRRSAGPPAATRTADRQLIATYCELLASCLDAGMAVAGALGAVSEALAAFDPSAGSIPGGAGSVLDAAGTGFGSGDAGPVRRRDGPIDLLDSVAAMLRLGADPSTAWRAAETSEDLAPIAAAARRSATGGGALAQAVREHAAQLRQQTAAADLRSAGRAGVLMTAPLGVCFLPAFLCLGLAPVVVGLLGQLDMF